jgi:hypothetical protein
MTDAPFWLPVAILFTLLLLGYLGMWRGWRRRARKHDLPPLVDVPVDAPAAVLQAGADYFGTTVNGDWLDRVVARGLGSRSSSRIALSADGLDVHRPSGAFRIPVAALHGARHDQGIAGKVVPPHGVLVVTWRHGEHLLDTGFRLSPTDSSSGAQLSEAEAARADPPSDNSAKDTSVRGLHNTWVQALTSMARADSVDRHDVEGENA